MTWKMYYKVSIRIGIFEPTCMVVAVGTGFCFAKFVHLRTFNKKSMVLSRTQFNFHLYHCMLFSLSVLGKLLGLHTEIIILVASTDLKKCKYPYLTRKLLAFKQEVARVHILTDFLASLSSDAVFGCYIAFIVVI